MAAARDPEGFSGARSTPPPSYLLTPLPGQGDFYRGAVVPAGGVLRKDQGGITYAVRRISDKIIYNGYGEEGGKRAQA